MKTHRFYVTGHTSLAAHLSAQGWECRIDRHYNDDAKLVFVFPNEARAEAQAYLAWLDRLRTDLESRAKEQRVTR